MTKKIAFLSGKGGSGKTSLSLSIANLLSVSGVKTLLVDCDLSTNGATYFFENYLKPDKKFCSVQNLIQNVFEEDKVEKGILSIQKNFDFIPSVPAIDGTILDSNDSLFFSFDIFDHIIGNYDVVLFDCQAGYSEILKDILENIDVTLFVMEADAISSASIRSLYLKVGSLLSSRNTFQVFNKVTNEEYEVYSKLTGATLFTNIESILFDWTIRRAFALSQIPTIDGISYSFYKQIISVCEILFPEKDLLEKIKTYSKQFYLEKIRARESTLTESLELETSPGKKNKQKWILIGMMFYLIVASVALCGFLLKDKLHIFYCLDYPLIISVVAVLLTIVAALVSVLSSRKTFANRVDVNSMRKSLSELKRLEKEIDKYISL